MLPKILNNSLYAQRLPIGTDDVLNHFKPEAIRSFYHDWYRPDLQAIIVVGDIDVNEMENLIRANFSDLKNPTPDKPREKYNIPLTGKNQFVVVTDAELPATNAEMIIKHKGIQISTVADYRQMLVRALFNEMLIARLEEISRKYDPPLATASAAIS